MDFDADHFTLMGLSRFFRIDAIALDKRYRDVLTEVHPDRFAAAGEAEKRLSLQWATRANDAYQTLKKPLSRAKYLLYLEGIDVGAENNTAMPLDFLMEQMEWREGVSEASLAGDHHELEHLHHRLGEQMRSAYEELADLFDKSQDFETAADRVRRLMFLEKLQHEIDDAIVTIEEA